jgi:hypothetical protein
MFDADLAHRVIVAYVATMTEDPNRYRIGRSAAAMLAGRSSAMA